MGMCFIAPAGGGCGWEAMPADDGEQVSNELQASAAPSYEKDEPRDYQKLAIEKCLAGNSIINLPINSGKTLIAVKVLDSFLEKKLC